MPYTAPTADQLQAMFPAFAAVADVTVDLYIVRGNRNVDASWTEGDYQNAIMLAAAHYMVLSGIGAGAVAGATGPLGAVGPQGAASDGTEGTGVGGRGVVARAGADGREARCPVAGVAR